MRGTGVNVLALGRLGWVAMIEIFVDADACPVKDEVYQVAARTGVPVAIVANQRMRVPEGLGIDMVVVPGDFDAADDWIADNVRRHDIVVTIDIPLAARCLEHGAYVVRHDGRPFTEDSIGSALAGRELSQYLRESGEIRGGPSGITGRDKSRFLSKLDELVQRGLRETGQG